MYWLSSISNKVPTACPDTNCSIGQTPGQHQLLFRYLFPSVLLPAVQAGDYYVSHGFVFPAIQVTDHCVSTTPDDLAVHTLCHQALPQQGGASARGCRNKGGLNKGVPQQGVPQQGVASTRGCLSKGVPQLNIVAAHMLPGYLNQCMYDPGRI